MKNCDKNRESYSYFGHNYTLPDGMELGSKESSSYLAGSYNFKVSEIEVFKVIDQ